MKKLFSQLSEEEKFLRATLPMWAPVSSNPDLDTEDMIEKEHDRFFELGEVVKDKLADLKTAEKIQRIGEAFRLDILQMASIARSVRNFYFGDIKKEDFARVYVDEMGIDEGKAQEIAKIVVQKVINDDSIEKEHAAQMERTALKDALKKYETLDEQLVTSERIEIKNSGEPVRPSIKNWLSDYTFNLGFEAHSSMDRGIYLFQNKNTKTLDTKDRFRLAFVLKAYDENSPVQVNVNLKQIVFPAPSYEPKKAEIRPQPQMRKEVPPAVERRDMPKPPEKKIVSEIHVNRSFPGNVPDAKKSLEAKIPVERIAPAPQPRLSVNMEKKIVPPMPPKEAALRKPQFEFSSSHQLPHEKEKDQSGNIPSQKPQLQPRPKLQARMEQVSQPKLEPMKIFPSGMRREEEEYDDSRENVSPGNIVNLKEES